MVSWNACKAADTLKEEGYVGLVLPHTDKSPIPGLMLFMDEGHRKVLLVRSDAVVVDLMAVLRAAEECVRNWHKGSTLPHFVGDFQRLTELAKCVNGVHKL